MLHKTKHCGLWKMMALVCVGIVLHSPLSTLHSVCAQAPGTTPVKVSHQTQMLHGRKYYVHIVETGQTRKITLPRIERTSIIPTSSSRLSCELVRLSPRTKTYPSGTTVSG